jgi:hypothetical protein
MQSNSRSALLQHPQIVLPPMPWSGFAQSARFCLCGVNACYNCIVLTFGGFDDARGALNLCLVAPMKRPIGTPMRLNSFFTARRMNAAIGISLCSAQIRTT